MYSMTHQKWYTKLMRTTVSSCSKRALILMAVVLHIVGDRFKTTQNQVATFLRFSIKSAAPPYQKKKKRTYYIPPVISLASFKEIKVSTQGKKKLHFFSLTLIAHDKIYFSYENIWKECFQDLCHCALFTSQMLFQECVQIIKTTSLCIGVLQNL